MKTKNPCIGCPDLQMDEYGYLCDLSCGKRTAWLNYMAGIREVVEWINTNIADAFPYAKEEWQAKLKEWGID